MNNSFSPLSYTIHFERSSKAQRNQERKATTDFNVNKAAQLLRD